MGSLSLSSLYLLSHTALHLSSSSHTLLTLSLSPASLLTASSYGSVSSYLRINTQTLALRSTPTYRALAHLAQTPAAYSHFSLLRVSPLCRTAAPLGLPGFARTSISVLRSVYLLRSSLNFSRFLLALRSLSSLSALPFYAAVLSLLSSSVSPFSRGFCAHSLYLSHALGLRCRLRCTTASISLVLFFITRLGHTFSLLQHAHCHCATTRTPPVCRTLRDARIRRTVGSRTAVSARTLLSVSRTPSLNVPASMPHARVLFHAILLRVYLPFFRTHALSSPSTFCDTTG